MDPKTYEKLQRVNYGGATCNITPLTLTADFMEYESVWARLHQFFLHDWGVASGLEVQASPGAASLQVQAGIAVDRKGNLIVLSTGGSGMLGDAAPLTEASVPVDVPTADLVSQKYLLTIQWRETRRQIASPSDFLCGKQEQTPQLRLQPVNGFADSDDYVCLAVVELDAGGVVKSINAQDSAAPLGRRLLGETVGAVRFQASTGSNPAGTVHDILAAALEPLPAGNGLKVTSALTALTGKLCIAPTSATPPADVPGSLVVLSNTPGGGGGVKTLDGNGKVLVALTSTGTGGQQAGYASMATAAGTEIVSLSASTTGAGQVQVKTRSGKAAIVLTTAGAADDGIVHVLSNDQDVVTLGSAGISSKGNISTEGAISSQGITTGTVTVQQGLTAGSIASQGAITAQGTITAQNNIATRGSVSCTFVQGQGWSAASGAISGSGWSHSAGGVAGSGWSQSAGGVSGSGWNLSAGGLSTGGWINTTQVVKAGGQVQCGGALIANGNVQSGGTVIATGNLQCGGAVFSKGWITTDQVLKAGGQVQCGGAVISQGNLQCAGQVIAQGDIFGRSKHFIMPHPTDDTKEIVYASIEGPESAAYVRGRATLQKGKAQVEFPEHFVVVVNAETLTIQLTPRSASSKGLAIVESGSNGFAVQELLDGAGSYDFDYFASGVRRGYEEYQPVVAKGYSPMKEAGGEAVMLAAMAAPVLASSMLSTPAPEVTATPEPAAPGSLPSMEPAAKPQPWDLL